MAQTKVIMNPKTKPKPIDLNLYITRAEAAALTGKSITTITTHLRELKASGYYVAEESTTYDLLEQDLFVNCIPPGKNRKSTLLLKEYMVKKYGMNRELSIEEARDSKKVIELLSEIKLQNELIIKHLKSK